MNKPWNKLTKKDQNIILYGSTEIINYIYESSACMNLHFKVIVQFF